MFLHTPRKAFSMMTAIMVILLMASVGAFVMNLSSKMGKETTAQYQREQAMLLANSYTEYAVMAVTANVRTGNCLTDIDNSSDVLGFTVRVRIAYIGGSTVDACALTRTFSSTVVTAASSLNIIIDVYVEYQDFEHHDPTNAPSITYHKRTLQKI